MPLTPLSPLFFERPVQQVARELLGCILVRQLDGSTLTGWINETEAYDGESDLACHARSGKTARTAPMYGPPGHAYVYFTYGMHWCFNCVTGPEGYPAAVLLRGLVVLEGQAAVAARRAGRPPRDWTSGPARLTQAFGIDGALNLIDLCNPSGPLWIAAQPAVAASAIHCGPRIGIERTPEPWRSQPWRFWTVFPGRPAG